TQANTGLTRALIRGCAEARGQLIARQDADDLSLPGRFRRQAAALAEDPGLAFVSCWAECIGPADELLYRVTPSMSSETATEEIIRGVSGPAGHGSVMFRRQWYERVGGYRAAFQHAQDSDLWLRLVHLGRLGWVPDVLYRFRVRQASISASRARLQREFDRLARACCHVRMAGGDEAPLVAEAQRLSDGMAGATGGTPSVAYFIGRCLVDRRDPRARSYLLQALRDHPVSLRVWTALARCLLTS